MRIPAIRILVISLLLLTLAPISRNEINRRRDGNWWGELNEYQKSEYMTGFLDGMGLGSDFSVWGLDKSDWDKVKQSYETYANRYVGNVTNRQIADGLNVFYTDYRNRHIRMERAVWLVLNQIAGKSDPEMEKMIENFRKNAD